MKLTFFFGFDVIHNDCPCDGRDDEKENALTEATKQIKATNPTMSE